MNTPRPDQERLERLIGAVLRELPPQAAPLSLETRVMRELASRAARPWWQQGFSRWPLAARLLFVPLSAAFIRLAWLAMSGVNSGVDAARHSSLVTAASSRLDAVASLGHSLQSLGNTVTGLVPTVWLYCGAALVALAYVTLLGIGAAAFRSLIAPTHAPR